MPATPQAAASPAPDWRIVRPADGPAAPAPAAAPAAAANSVLDALLVTLGGGDTGPSARSGHSLQPLALPPPALPPSTVPAAQRQPPGAPRRHSRPLPPPPEVPPEVLAALHPAGTPAAGTSPFASYGAAGPCCDTACSGWDASGDPDVHPALLQAFAWLDTCQPTGAAGDLP